MKSLAFKFPEEPEPSPVIAAATVRGFVEADRSAWNGFVHAALK